MSYGVFCESGSIIRLATKETREEAIDILDVVVPRPSDVWMVEDLYIPSKDSEHDIFYGYDAKSVVGVNLRYYVKKIKK